MGRFFTAVLDSGAKVKYYEENNLNPINLTEGTDYVLNDKIQQEIDLLSRVMPDAKVAKLNVLDFDEINNLYKIKNKDEYFYLSNYDAERNIIQHKFGKFFSEKIFLKQVPDLQLGNYNKTSETYNMKYGDQKIKLTKLSSNTGEDQTFIYQNDYSKIPEIDLKIKKKRVNKLK